jgi:hypothetical protein
MNGPDGMAWMAQRAAELEARLSAIASPMEAVPMVEAARIDPRLAGGLTEAIGYAIAGLRRQLRAPDLARRIARCQLRADALFATLDLLTDAVAQRANASIGLQLAGTEVLAKAALAARVPGYQAPPPLCYLDGGRGGEIRRARVQLGGGVILPAALIAVGLASLATRLSTVLHEAGHQLAVDLGLLHEAERVIQTSARATLGSGELAEAWLPWTGELLADAWSVCTGGGVLALDGLQRLLIGMPPALAGAIFPGAPHPPAVIRVRFALELGRALEGQRDPVLEQLDRRWSQSLESVQLPARRRTVLHRLAEAAPAVARAFARHAFTGLGRQRLAIAGRHHAVRGAEIERHLTAGLFATPAALAAGSPLAAIAVLCRARLRGLLSPFAAERASRELLEHLAYRRAGAHSSSSPRGLVAA